MKIKVAVVGYGHLGKWHAEKLESFSEVATLKFIVEKQPPRLLAAKKDHPTATVVKDISECIDQIDAAIVVTPAATHFEIVEYLLKKNKHVFCEKPLTENMPQAFKLEQAKHGKNLVLQVGHSERFHEIWESKERYHTFLTSPSHIVIRRMSLFKGRALDVDVVQDLMIHDLDLLLFLFAEIPTSIETFGLSMTTQYNDYASSVFKFESGHRATITTGRSHIKETREIEIFNRQGTVSIDLLRSEVVEALYSRPEPNCIKVETYKKRDLLKLQQSHFYDSIIKNKDPIVSLADGIKAVWLSSKVLESIKAGRLIEIKSL